MANRIQTAVSSVLTVMTAAVMTAAVTVATVIALGSIGASTASAAGISVVEHGATLTVTHALGTTIVEKNPETVVVFDYGVLDSLQTLGVEPAAVPKSSLPPYLSEYRDARYDDVGTLIEPDFEAINELRPDLIVISGRQSEHYEELSEIGPTIFMAVDTTRYIESFRENARALGHIFGQERLVEAELAHIDEAVQRVRRATSGKSTLLLLVTGGKANAFGPGSRYGFVFDVLGLRTVDESIVSASHGQSISFEFIVAKDPDYILVIDRDAAIGSEGAQPAKQVIENALVKHTRAYQNGHISYLDPGYWYLSGGGLVSFSKMVGDIEAAVR